MRKLCCVAVVGVSLLALLGSSAEADSGKSGSRFWGLWEGIDPLDGSTQQISISGGTERRFSLLWRESYWTICGGKRGIVNGSGALDPGDRKTLVAQITITCFDPDELVIEDTITLELTGQNMLLVSDRGEFEDLPFFRVSARVRAGGGKD